LVAAFVQATYIHLSAVLPVSYIIAASAIFIGAFGIKPFLIAVQAARAEAFVCIILVAYVLLLATFYRGFAIVSFALPALSIGLFYTSLNGLGSSPRSLKQIGAATPYVIVLAGTIHLIAVLNRGSLTQKVKVGDTSLRYGYVDGVNLINLTGSNAALLALAGYAFARFAKARPISRLIALAGTVMLVAPVAASLSRAAALMFAVGVVAMEAANALAAYRSVTARKRMIAALAGAAILGFLYMFASKGGLAPVLGAVADRFEVGLSGGDAIRAKALQLSLGEYLSLFGTLREGSATSTGARDNTIANFLLSYGVIGFIIASTLLVLAVHRFGRQVGAAPAYAVVGLTPILLRSVGEGTYVPTSSLFCALLYLAVLAAVLRRQVTFDDAQIRSSHGASTVPAPIGRGQRRQIRPSRSNPF
jgi:hypothetical protein